jgi:hypothetical protein
MQGGWVGRSVEVKLQTNIVYIADENTSPRGMVERLFYHDTGFGGALDRVVQIGVSGNFKADMLKPRLAPPVGVKEAKASCAARAAKHRERGLATARHQVETNHVEIVVERSLEIFDRKDGVGSSEGMENGVFHPANFRVHVVIALGARRGDAWGPVGLRLGHNAMARGAPIMGHIGVNFVFVAVRIRAICRMRDVMVGGSFEFHPGGDCSLLAIDKVDLCFEFEGSVV